MAKVVPVIRESAKEGIVFRGGAQQLWKSHDQEVLLSGPADTGKTFSSLHKLDSLLWKYPRSQALMVRKSQRSLYGTVCVTFQQKVANMKLIEPYGGEKTPDRYIYPNGSIIWLGGLDNPDKVLSAERDFIYVNQAEELSEHDWETLLTRVSGRAGNAPYAQLLGDCNPSGSRHWIRARAARGALRLLLSTHRDNPSIYNEDGTLTPSGIVRLRALDSLTGVRRKRLLEGIWATAEGAVYDMFDPAIHVLERSAEEMRSWYLAMDEGYTNPAVILLVGEDGDGRLHIFREFYEAGKLQGEVVAKAKEWYEEKRCWMAAVDSAAAGLIADLVDAGIPAEPWKGRILDGVTKVQERLRVAADGRPRLTVDPSCVNTINEFESYAWREGRDEPEKQYDHTMDAIRYLVFAVESYSPSGGIHV